MPPKKDSVKKSTSVKKTSAKSSKKKDPPPQNVEMQIEEEELTQPQSPEPAKAPKLVPKEYNLRKKDLIKGSKTVAKKMTKLLASKDAKEITALL